MIVVAHSLSTIRSVDSICMIDDGCFVEYGSHDELLAKEGAYSAFLKQSRQSKNCQHKISVKDTPTEGQLEFYSPFFDVYCEDDSEDDASAFNGESSDHNSLRCSPRSSTISVEHEQARQLSHLE